MHGCLNRFKITKLSSKSTNRRILSEDRERALKAQDSILSDNGIAACRVLGIFMTRKMIASLFEVSRGSTKPIKMIKEQENNFWVRL